jgi:16S rRNA (uracil1498-N3)-methyltransferase
MLHAKRLVLPPGSLAPGRLELGPDVAHYVRHVLRSRPGDRFELADGEGALAEATASELGVERAVLEVGPIDRSPFEGIEVTLIQAIGKRDKMDSVIRQASELGARRIVPVRTERTIAEQGQRADRWRTIADDALRVSGARYRTEVEAIADLSEILAAPRSELPLAMTPGAPALASELRGRSIPRTAEILIGPEGGLTPSEIEAAGAARFVAVGLGPRVLRTETAGPAALAILLSWAGALGARQ